MKFQKAFLSDWLIKKNVDKALKYFHEEAFISKAMYTADCASFGARDFYIKTKNRRKAVLLALSWYIHELKNFRDFYSLDAAELLKGSEVRPLNNIEEDKFGVWPGSNFNKSPLSKVNEVSITLKKILKKLQKWSKTIFAEFSSKLCSVELKHVVVCSFHYLKIF